MLGGNGHLPAMNCAALVISSLVVSASAFAQPALRPAPPAPIDANLHLSYEAFAAGLSVIELAASVELTPQSYRVETRFRTSGLFGAVVHAESASSVSGRWQGRAAVPVQFYSYGTLRGTPRRTQIDYVGGEPFVRVLEPADDDREPVAKADERNAIDTLSALALLVHEFASTGSCGGETRIFDGRRVSEITVTDGGVETLEPDHHSRFRGAAHRCDFVGRQIAGFVKDVDRHDLQKPQRGAAWLAPALPGQTPMPVRIRFHTRFFGDATMYLDDAGPGSTIPK